MSGVSRRRLFGGAAAVAAAGVAAPALAQTAPVLRWRLTSSYPNSLEALFGGCRVFTEAIAEMTDQKFQIQVFAPGEIVGGLQAADAVADGTVEACQSASYYYWGKDPTFALATAVPFGLNTRMQNAWMYQGGGIDMMNAFYARYNLFGLPGGNTGGQMGGWYRREINSPQDWRGLKIRIGGFGGSILSRLGALPQQIAGSDVYSALEKGAIDAAEWTTPADDEKLGLQRVAKYYYYPGWWEGQAILHFFFNLEKWNELPKAYQAIVKAAAQVANERMLAAYDLLNPPALRRLVADGAVLKVFSEDVLDACFKASNEVYGELSVKNADFKRIYESMMAVRADMDLTLQITEYTYDTYMMIQQRKGAL
jgi:TRAP-type mannitol/chloroaromatic compound transport system substrate-binding protein